MTKRWLALLLLVAAPLAAQEDVRPDHLNQTSGWSGAYTDIDEDVDGTLDGNLVWTSIAGNKLIWVGFASPSADPTTGTDEQTIKIAATKNTSTGSEDAGGGTPTYDIDVSSDNGTEWASLATGVSINGLDQIDSYTWTYPAGTGDPTDGSLVVVRFTTDSAGGGPNRRFGAIEAIEWVASVASAADQMMIIGEVEPTTRRTK